MQEEGTRGQTPIAPCREVKGQQRKLESLPAKLHRRFLMNWATLSWRIESARKLPGNPRVRSFPFSFYLP